MSLKTLLTAAAVAGLCATGASAATVNFTNIAGGDTYGDSLAGMFSLEVTSFSATQVLIQVISAANAGMTYFIGGIFIDDDPGFALSGETTAFSAANSTPGNLFNYNLQNLPQGNLVGFDETASYLRATGQGCSANACGIQQGQHAGFIFGGDLTTVLAAFDAGTLRFGLHVQGIGQYSDAFATQQVSSVPLPAGGLLLLGGLAGLAALRRKRKSA